MWSFQNCKVNHLSYIIILQLICNFDNLFFFEFVFWKNLTEMKVISIIIIFLHVLKIKNRMFYTCSNSFDILLHRGSIVLYVDIFNVRNVIRPANFTVFHRKNAACSLEGVRCPMLLYKTHKNYKKNHKTIENYNL